MPRVHLLLSLALAAGLVTPAAADEPPAPRRTNIVLILADDLCNADVTACRGGGPCRSRPGLLTAPRKSLEPTSRRPVTSPKIRPDSGSTSVRAA